MEIKSYKSAWLAIGKKWFVEYYIYNIELNMMVRKKIMLNSIEKVPIEGPPGTDQHEKNTKLLPC
ncbi:MAG: hypothetical protein ACOYN4_10695 [Bacteroidales bacterium]